ncbi:hypothetical protein K7X08_019485 [Anisodus acutangulus]|uniref:Uncharacterized protein n=1 Tax=Anisodus acutangulus TaxID=402998 RepID=A0A9Q1MRR2_9SOLA|nr:hypothetical protein K7X08_019485 [Anisodus acutangulus]
MCFATIKKLCKLSLLIQLASWRLAIHPDATIAQVHNLIERHLQLHMNQNQVVSTLSYLCTANGMAKSILESVGEFCIAFNATLAIFRGRAHEITRCSYSFTGEEKIFQRADACLGIRSYTSSLKRTEKESSGLFVTLCLTLEVGSIKLFL